MASGYRGSQTCIALPSVLSGKTLPQQCQELDDSYGESFSVPIVQKALGILGTLGGSDTRCWFRCSRRAEIHPCCTLWSWVHSGESALPRGARNSSSFSDRDGKFLSVPPPTIETEISVNLTSLYILHTIIILLEPLCCRWWGREMGCETGRTWGWYQSQVWVL